MERLQNKAKLGCKRLQNETKLGWKKILEWK